MKAFKTFVELLSAMRDVRLAMSPGRVWLRLPIRFAVSFTVELRAKINASVPLSA